MPSADSVQGGAKARRVVLVAVDVLVETCTPALEHAAQHVARPGDDIRLATVVPFTHLGATEVASRDVCGRNWHGSRREELLEAASEALGKASALLRNFEVQPAHNDHTERTDTVKGACM